MTKRQWMVGLALAGVGWLSLPAARAVAKPPDLPVEQRVRCVEALETAPHGSFCVDAVGPLIIQQFCELVLEVRQDRQDIGEATRQDACAGRSGTWIRGSGDNERSDRLNEEDASDESSGPDQGAPPSRGLRRESVEDVRYRDMLRKTSPLGVVPLMLH